MLHRDRCRSLLELSAMSGEVVVLSRPRETTRLAAPVGGHRLCQSKKAESATDPARGHPWELLLARRRASSRSIPYAMCSAVTVFSFRRIIKRMAFRQALSISAGL